MQAELRIHVRKHCKSSIFGFFGKWTIRKSTVEGFGPRVASCILSTALAAHPITKLGI